MKQASLLVAVLVLLLQCGYWLAGYQAIFQIGFGAITLMGLMIALTFLWLYLQRATPLALGMAYSWCGASLVLGWWWIYALLGAPEAMTASALHFTPLAVYLSGAVLHFSVIHRSFGWHGAAFLAPVLGAVMCSTAIYVIIQSLR
ncbi:hypothetical protein SAMN04488030_0811 [Aliiroseovarius halocynthiae]|uniref:DUF4175 domain-containing protein n=1 Tax=Aliiroseovarius halocynthiae TaxID=985055 RepID=A0A545SUX4_9RHOB|nr:hypothetical protein [Aliiroseovarius halocynthiae]TQV68760.1 hypothetical protein FIL88_04040 [Aliiroseovarius halocynthiae]SMR71184.1 hypothetical protein SAMN04488030_0811 [Aliiroseovarius halocynthiae]